MAIRLLFVQAGDYAEAYHRLSAGGEETYYAQGYSLGVTQRLAQRLEAVGMLSIMTHDHEEVLPDGVTSMGIRLYPEGRRPRWKPLMDRVQGWNPTHVILACPLPGVIHWGLKRGVRILPWFADSFKQSGVKGRYRVWRTARALRRRQLDWVTNHNVNACLNLVEIGVEPSRVIPWDWPPSATPDAYPPKPGPPTGPIRLIFVGQVVDSKGVGDAIEAVKLLRDAGRVASLTILGDGEIDRFREVSRSLGVAEAVDFRGRVANRLVLELMREHDAVLVPSWRAHAEGLPFTIHESFCSRTPLIASDHPMFRGKVEDRVSGLIFPERQPRALADRVETLLTEPGLYAAISERGKQAWERLRCPVGPEELFNRWLNNTPEDHRWLADHALTSGRYDTSI